MTLPGADVVTMQSPSRQLGELLVDRKLLSREALEECLVRETATGMDCPAGSKSET